MPKQDGTGPAGQGPRTGRGQGLCQNGGRQFCGCANGRRRFISQDNELNALDNEEKRLEEELAIIRREKSALAGQQK